MQAMDLTGHPDDHALRFKDNGPVRPGLGDDAGNGSIVSSNVLESGDP